MLIDRYVSRYCLQRLKSTDRLLISLGIFQGKSKQFACNLKCKYCVFYFVGQIWAQMLENQNLCLENVDKSNLVDEDWINFLQEKARCGNSNKLKTDSYSCLEYEILQVLPQDQSLLRIFCQQKEGIKLDSMKLLCFLLLFLS